jgi:hypothetical protein
VNTLPPEIIGLLARVRRAQTWTQALRWGTVAMFAAAGAALAWTVAGTVLSVTLPPLGVLAGGIGAALLITLVRGQLASRRLELVARIADAQMATRERISTAVDLAAGRIPATALADRVMIDAARAARAAAVVRMRPRAPAAARWAVVVVAIAAAAALLIPGLTLPATPARGTAERIKQEGRRLEQAGRKLQEQARTARAPQARRAAPEVQRLGRELQRQRLDRAAAQARIAALQRQLEAARRRIGERIGEALAPQTRPQPPDALFRQPTDLDRSVRQLRELAARLAEMPVSEGERRDLAQQLSDLAQSGEGRLPAPARRQTEEAQRQLGAGNVAGAGEALRQALQELEALEALMSDDQALRRTQRELEQSSDRIARGGAGRGRSDEERRGEGPQAQPAPGAQRPQGQGGEEVPAPPEGPHEGSTPGQGKEQSKLGAASPRLEARGERSRVRGQEAPGQLQTSEILGPGRREPARTAVRPLSPAAAAQADEHLARQRIPADLRTLVRRYFDILARQK